MPKQDKYKYKFSFIMPVYKVEKYLEETVESILAQTLDFEQNCEIIFINDGSPDKSEEICLRYQAQYPKNIKYIKQENSGVSVARNRGLREREGEYVSFLDSDDKISSDTLEKVYDFFLVHKDEIDFVSIKLKYFDSREGDHPLNFKYHTTRVIDIEKEYDTAQLSGGSVFVKSDVFKNSKYRFDKNIKVSEDAKLLTELVLEKMAYGVVSEPTYYYRKRQGSVSATSGSMHDRGWYMNTPAQVYQYLFNYSKKRFGFVAKYIQYLVMYDLQWRFKQKQQTVLTENELSEYKKILISLLQDIDEGIILMQRNISVEYKIFILSKKYGKSVEEKIQRSGLEYLYNGQAMDEHSHKGVAVHLEFINITNNNIVAEGYFDGPILSDTRIVFSSGKSSGEVVLVDRPLRYVEFIGEIVTKRHCFKAELPVQPGVRVEFQLVSPDVGAQRVPMVAHKYTHLNQTIGRAYKVCSDYIFIKRPDYLEIVNYSHQERFIRELKYLLALAQNLKLYSVLVRVIYFIAHLFFGSKKIWLILDRVNAAGDNAEALFRYVVKESEKEISPYFVVSRQSDDFNRMKSYGKVIAYGSIKHKILFLLSSKIISSHADAFITNVFGGKEHNLIDLYNFDFVFLQHGVTHNDISSWINRYNKDIRLLVSAAKPEYSTFLEGDYGYSEDVVKLTGFPRYDLLNNNPQKKLIIAPTWRSNLTITADPLTGIRPYSSTFKDSEYFKFYQSLLNDEILTNALKEHGMRGEFYLHPSLSSQIKDFSASEDFMIKDIPFDYRTAFSEGDLMVTDYSSVAFDFAYLKKLVIYAQFDRQAFYAHHNWDPGYFSYEYDGFGPVTEDYENTVKEIIAAIKGKSVMPKKYTKRVERFFYKFDQNNSKRVYEAILTMDKGDG